MIYSISIETFIYKHIHQIKYMTIITINLPDDLDIFVYSHKVKEKLKSKEEAILSVLNLFYRGEKNE